MAKLTPLEEVKKKLPAFVQIKDETYRGVRYNATFTDTEYNQEFVALPKHVIKYQSGCKNRRIQRFKDNPNKVLGSGKRVPIEDIKLRLPDYVTIDESSYKGIREKARFYDKDYDVWFEGCVSNVVREGKAYCPERRAIEFKKATIFSPEKIQSNVDSIYKGRIVLVKDTYVNTQTSCSWLFDGKEIRMEYSGIIGGRFLDRDILKQWLSYVKVRDNFICQKCEKTGGKICGHHILTWANCIGHRFNINNGISLCSLCHNNYHSLYKWKETLDNFCDWIGKEKEPLIRERLAAPILLPNF